MAIDDGAAAYEVASYLVGRGHSRIATVTGPLNTSGGRDRYEGYKRAVGSGSGPASSPRGTGRSRAGVSEPKDLARDAQGRCPFCRVGPYGLGRNGSLS